MGTRAWPGGFSFASVEVLDPGAQAGQGKREARGAERETTLSL